MGIFDDAIPDLAAGEQRETQLGGHTFVIEATQQQGFYTGRRQYKVHCKTCNMEVHDGTTGPDSWMTMHLRDAPALPPTRTDQPI